MPRCGGAPQKTVTHERLQFLIVLAPAVQNVDNSLHRINHHLLENVIGFPHTYPLDSDLPGPGFLKRWIALSYPPDKSLSRG